MNKKGFTLVELMVVIVIIGVLAAVAIPKMVAAADKAKAAEGPQMLGTISNLQHAYRAAANTFISCPMTANSAAGAKAVAVSTCGWAEIGLDVTPFSRYFNFAVTEAGGAEAAAFTAHAIQFVRLGGVTGGALTVDHEDARTAGTLGKLVPSWAN